MKSELGFQVGTVVVATKVIVDWNGDGEPRIVAEPGDRGIVFADYRCGRNHPAVEVKFDNGVFTTQRDLSASEGCVRRYSEGPVYNVVAPPKGCGHIG